MEAVKLAGLQPASVFGYFEKLCSYPHGSGNTKQISDYLVEFAKEQGLRYIQDALNNVAYKDDSQIYSAYVLKFYAECPGVKIRMTVGGEHE